MIIAKNNTGSVITIADLCGVQIPISGQTTLTDTLSPADISDSDDLVTLIGDEDVIINDGTADLELDDAKRHVSLASTRIAVSDEVVLVASGVSTQQYYFEVTSTTYQVIRQFIYRGTSKVGTPNIAKLIAWVSSTDYLGLVRLYDITNDNVIALWDNINSTEEGSIWDVSPVNLPYSDSVFEIQGKRLTIPEGLYITSITLGFD
jgi:hypothetical protein